jgi:hypothetical protein
MSCTETKNESSHTVCGLEQERELELERDLERELEQERELELEREQERELELELEQMIHYHPEGTPVERLQAVIERAYEREARSLRRAEKYETDDRTLMEMWEGLFPESKAVGGKAA